MDNLAKKTDDSSTKVSERIEMALLDARRIFISNQIDNKTAQDVIRKLWYLEMTAPGKPILLVINSPGGSVHDGFAIWDQCKMITSPVTTLITGLAASMGSVLSLCAKKGRRFATQEASVMIHQPLIAGVIQGQATDLDIQAKEMLKAREKLVQIYVDATGKDYDTIDRAIDRDTWMTSTEALAYGLIDKIVSSFAEIEAD